MNTATNQLVLEITETVLRVNAQGRWHGFIHLSGHTEQIEVYFYPASTDYRQPTEQWPQSHHQSTYTAPHLYDSATEMRRALRKLLSFARAHLAQPGKEAA